MDLIPYMYFERQEQGSQLCAQHCLNNILQQRTYTEFDLADIAQKLDFAENAALSVANQNKKSYNLDDTGFFSLQTLERALQVWDLTLVRWRGEAMKPYQDRPEDQSAFILHLAQHWLPLRRFAPSPPHVSAVKRWYNLNSFLGAPEWISPTYLKMVLTQAEQEGYSVFVVRRAGTASTGDKGKETDMIEGEGWGDGGVGVLPECLADTMAVELGEPVGRSGGFGSGSATTMDQPSVDQSSLAGPSSSAQPKSRRKRQQDLDGAIPSDDPFLQQPGSSSAAQPSRFDDDTLEEDEMGDEPGASDFANHTRAYDDEDAAFQAALRASMEDVPEGWVAPDFGKKKTAGEGVVKRELPTPPVSVVQRAPPAEVAPAQNWRPAGGATEPRAPLREIPTEAAVEEDGTPLSPTEELTQDEIRRRRLAKFGA